MMKWYDKQKTLFEEKNGIKDKPMPSETLGTNEIPPVETKEKSEAENMFENKDNQNDQEREVIPGFAASQNANVTTIHRETVLNGNINTSDDLIVYGTINGDIVSECNVTIYGKVEGTITCVNIDMENATINGDVSCSDSMRINETSVIVGDVKASALISGGKIKGNADVAGDLHFCNTAAIIGDITCRDLEIEKGAYLQGNIKITKEVDF